MGVFLIYVALWFVFCQGFLGKDDKFLSLSTYIITPTAIVMWTLEAFVSSTEPAVSGEKIAARAAIGAVFGLVYCVLYANELRTEKRFPLMAGIVAVICSVGYTLICFGLLNHLG
jgi:uncharacterized protein YacL